jgi:peptidoglycan endopeptidase LytE
MLTIKSIRWLIFVSLFVLLIVYTEPVIAGSSPCGGSVTVVSGDTLYKIATRCGTSVNALKLANNLTDVNQLKVGQVLLMPGAVIKGSDNVDIYIVNHGDTLSEIARLFNTTLSKLISLNSSIKNINLIFAGQHVNVPSPNTAPPEDPPADDTKVYIVQRGDWMNKIANRLSISLTELIKLNPQVKNINLIYVNQKLNIPEEISFVITARGDTLQKIADSFGMSLEALMKLNPEIKNPNQINAGEVIKIQ